MRDTIDMARESKVVPVLLTPHGEYFTFLERFAELVRADEREEFQRWFDAVTAQHKQMILAEREACAKLCETTAPSQINGYECADVIRARGQA